jgi:hypothetical protein
MFHMPLLVVHDVTQVNILWKINWSFPEFWFRWVREGERYKQYPKKVLLVFMVLLHLYSYIELIILTVTQCYWFFKYTLRRLHIEHSKHLKCCRQETWSRKNCSRRQTEGGTLRKGGRFELLDERIWWFISKMYVSLNSLYILQWWICITNVLST